MFKLFSNTRFAALLAISPLLAVNLTAQNYQVTNLVANLAGNANTTDPNLVDAWGLTRSSGSPWWIADNVTGVSTLYDGSGNIIPLVVTIPAATKGATGSPTGAMYNGSTGFQLAPNKPAVFIFCTNDGTISGWNPGVNPTNAVIMASKPNAIYPGATIATWNGNEYLYAANVFSRKIDVYDSSFKPVTLPEHAFRIPDHVLDSESEHGVDIFDLFGPDARSYAPHNIQNIGGVLYVPYTKQDSNFNEVFGSGFGFLVAFTPGGEFIRAFQYGPWFNSPWGLTIAPNDFGSFSHTLLVGNLGSGEILGFNLEDGSFVGKLADQNGKTIQIDR
ncbi:MAG: TIGR03118 family protein, partial [Bryobacteraceae bacterium]